MKEDIKSAIVTLTQHTNNSGVSEEQWKENKEMEHAIEQAWMHADDITVKYGLPKTNSLKEKSHADTKQIPLFSTEDEQIPQELWFNLTGINPPESGKSNSFSQITCWVRNENNAVDPLFVLSHDSATLMHNQKLVKLELSHIEAIETILSFIEQGCAEMANAPAPTEA
ncbi:MAG TPA: hypothetical protein VMR81_06005 [Patescibacteria group bacterium]|nr:hypothetical protein [Patescibacteria group bacterium]